MEYAVGKTGRVIAARLFEGEPLYETIEALADKEGLASGAVFITGGFRKAEVVVGPLREAPKLEGNFKSFTGPGETLGVGTLYPDDTGRPKLHLHAGMCRGDEMVIGCPRGGASTFLILEVTIIEFVDIPGRRLPDPATGAKLLRFSPDKND